MNAELSCTQQYKNDLSSSSNSYSISSNHSRMRCSILTTNLQLITALVSVGLITAEFLTGKIQVGLRK